MNQVHLNPAKMLIAFIVEKSGKTKAGLSSTCESLYPYIVRDKIKHLKQKAENLKTKDGRRLAHKSIAILGKGFEGISLYTALEWLDNAYRHLMIIENNKSLLKESEKKIIKKLDETKDYEFRTGMSEQSLTSILKNEGDLIGQDKFRAKFIIAYILPEYYKEGNICYDDIYEQFVNDEYTVVSNDGVNFNEIIIEFLDIMENTKVIDRSIRVTNLLNSLQRISIQERLHFNGSSVIHLNARNFIDTNIPILKKYIIPDENAYMKILAKIISKTDEYVHKHYKEEEISDEFILNDLMRKSLLLNMMSNEDLQDKWQFYIKDLPSCSGDMS